MTPLEAWMMIDGDSRPHNECQCGAQGLEECTHDCPISVLWRAVVRYEHLLRLAPKLMEMTDDNGIWGHGYWDLCKEIRDIVKLANEEVEQ